MTCRCMVIPDSYHIEYCVLHGAAPDLLAKLEGGAEIVDSYENGEFGGIRELEVRIMAWRDSALAAIAQVKGEA